jgi:RimJ/RimL family protein N-acetyltransferase
MYKLFSVLKLETSSQAREEEKASGQSMQMSIPPPPPPVLTSEADRMEMIQSWISQGNVAVWDVELMGMKYMTKLFDKQMCGSISIFVCVRVCWRDIVDIRKSLRDR